MVVIAVSGLPGAGNSTVAKVLAQKLGLDYFSVGKYFKSFSKEETESDKAISVFKSDEGMSRDFHARIDELQIQKAKKGNIVIDSKLAFYFLKGLADYKVWIDVPLKVRAQRTAKRDDISVEEAERKIVLRHDMENFTFQKAYGIKYEDLKNNANIIIDASKDGIGEIVDKIIKQIKK